MDRRGLLGGGAGGSAPAGGASALATGAVPLITCTECHRFKVVRRVSTRPWSEGQVYYCCPAHKSKGQGCPFFEWESEYLKLLASRDMEEEGAEVVPMLKQKMKMKEPTCSLVIEPNHSMDEQRKEDRAVVVVGSEVIKLMKVQSLLSLCILVVVLVILVVMLFK